MREPTKQEMVAQLNGEIEKLKADLEKRNERIKLLEESRNNVLESCRITQREQKKKIRELENASFQIDQMCNSIMMYLADKHRGKLKVPKNHLKITSKWGFECVPQGDYYIFTVHKGDTK